MTELDLLILTIYVITVTYVLYQMIESLEAKTTIAYEKAEVDRQIEERGLKAVLDVKFKFDDRYSFDKPDRLAITVENKSEHSAIYVDWDRSTLSDIGKRSRRVIRLTPDRRLDDLFQPQMSSPITPGSSLSETLTTEDVLKREGVGDRLEPGEPLINITKLGDSVKASKASDADKKLYNEFMAGQAPLRFSLQLALRIRDLQRELGDDRFYSLTCPFAINKVPWQDALPFNPKK
jgi:hypothetical protein